MCRWIEQHQFKHTVGSPATNTARIILGTHAVDYSDLIKHDNVPRTYQPAKSYLKEEQGIKEQIKQPLLATHNTAQGCKLGGTSKVMGQVEKLQ